MNTKKRLKQKVGSKEPIHVLDSGFSATCSELAKIVGIAPDTMRQRLSKSLAVSKILVCYPSYKNTTSHYDLSNGKRYTVREIATITNRDVSSIRSQLQTTLDAKLILIPIKPSKSEKIFTLSNQRKGTSSEFAKEVGITKGQMSMRLSRSLNVADVLKPKQTDGNINKIIELSDGTVGTVSDFARLAKRSRQCIFSRLKKTTNAAIVLKEREIYVIEDTEITLPDGSKGTPNEWSKKYGLCTNTIHLRISTWYSLAARLNTDPCDLSDNEPLKDPNGDKHTATELTKIWFLSPHIIIKRLKESTLEELLFLPAGSFLLDDGQIGTAISFSRRTGYCRKRILRRLLTSRDPVVILAPKILSKDKVHKLSNGEEGTAEFFANMIHITELAMKQRLAVSLNAEKVLYCANTEFTLDDGQKGTTKYFSELIGITNRLMKKRLLRSSDPIIVLQRITKWNSHVFTLDNGEKGTTSSFSEKYNILLATLKQRLMYSTNPDIVLRVKENM